MNIGKIGLEFRERNIFIRDNLCLLYRKDHDKNSDYVLTGN